MLRLEAIQLSPETIYSYIAEDTAAGGSLHKNLRINGKRRYRRRTKAGRVGKIPGRVGIEDRPLIVEKRRRYGDWEADLIEGSKGSGYLLSLYERKSRLGKLVHLPNKNAALTARAIIAVLSPYKAQTITYDNGLVRQYFPKGSDFSKITARELLRVENALNTRPRKTLGYQSPSNLEKN